MILWNISHGSLWIDHLRLRRSETAIQFFFHWKKRRINFGLLGSISQYSNSIKCFRRKWIWKTYIQVIILYNNLYSKSLIPLRNLLICMSLFWKKYYFKTFHLAIYWCVPFIRLNNLILLKFSQKLPILLGALFTID